MTARTYLVECYAPGIEQGDVEAAADRARAAASNAAAHGEPVAYLGALLVADDDAVFHAFHAEGREVVEAASHAAGLAFTRIVESVSVQGGGTGATLQSLLAGVRRPRSTEAGS